MNRRYTLLVAIAQIAIAIGCHSDARVRRDMANNIDAPATEGRSVVATVPDDTHQVDELSREPRELSRIDVIGSYQNIIREAGYDIEVGDYMSAMFRCDDAINIITDAYYKGLVGESEANSLRSAARRLSSKASHLLRGIPVEWPTNGDGASPG